MQCTYTTQLFFFSRYLFVYLGRIPVSTMMLCGVLAGCIGGGFGNPADVVNIRMVNDGKLPKEQQRHYKHAFDGLYRIVKEEGPGQLMRGLGPNMNRAILMTSSQLVSYDGFKRQLLATPWFKDNLATHFASSLLAVSVSLFCLLCIALPSFGRTEQPAKDEATHLKVLFRCLAIVYRVLLRRQFVRHWMCSKLEL